MKTEQTKEWFVRNAEEIRKLHGRINETYRQRSKSPGGTEEWQRACAEFRARYDSLAFPGGAETAVARMAQGDADAIEAALCFLELRPYFFRSGYMFKTFRRKLKRAQLDARQTARYERVVQAYEEWRQMKREGKA
ncbi:MAG TPA: hypothetical protein VFS76_15365 [Pyrinomonadaceae bacterium]|nr:hypothetical protein [Pyrinomonadaceae bacterium]